jgi:hypothetical protein
MTEEEIARHLAEAAASGELRAAPSYGKPLAPDEGWEQTPETLRMPFKILRDANCPPPEIALFQRRAALREALDVAGDEATRVALRRELSDLEQKLSLRLEGLARLGTL